MKLRSNRDGVDIGDQPIVSGLETFPAPDHDFAGKGGMCPHPDRQPHSSTTNNSVCGRVLATQCRSFTNQKPAQFHTLLAAIRHQSLSSWRDGHRLLCLDALVPIHSLRKKRYNYKQCSCEAIWLHARAENESFVVQTFHDGTYLQTGVSTHIEW